MSTATARQVRANVSIPGQLDDDQIEHAKLIYRLGRQGGLPPNRSRELVAAAYAESSLDPNAKNPSSGAAGFFQLLNSRLRKLAIKLGGLFDPEANTKAILPDYVAYWRRRPNARAGEGGRDVERSGEGASFYAEPLDLFAWLNDSSAKAPSTYTGPVFPVPGHKPPEKSTWGAPRGSDQPAGHEGQDIFAPAGTKVVAPVAGTITEAGDDGGRGGIRVWLNDTYYFAHLQRLGPGIRKGVKVKKGQVIGYVGTTGDAAGTPPHLHFGMTTGDDRDAWIDPHNTLIGWWGRAATRGKQWLDDLTKKGKSAAGGAAGGATGTIAGVSFLLDRLGLLDEGVTALKRGAVFLLLAVLGLALVLAGVLRMLGVRPGAVVNVARGVEP